MCDVVEDMVRQTRHLDMTKYKVRVVWDSQANCDVGWWITLRESCGGKELEEPRGRYEVRDWNFDISASDEKVMKVTALTMNSTVMSKQTC